MGKHYYFNLFESVLLEFDPNRGKEGRAVPRYGHFPTSSKVISNIKSEFGGNLPLPKRKNKPINLLRRASQEVGTALRAGEEPSTKARTTRDRLSTYLAARQGERHQADPRTAGEERGLETAHQAGSAFPNYTGGDQNESPKEKMLGKIVRFHAGHETPAQKQQVAQNQQRIALARKARGGR